MRWRLSSGARPARPFAAALEGLESWRLLSASAGLVGDLAVTAVPPADVAPGSAGARDGDSAPACGGDGSAAEPAGPAAADPTAIDPSAGAAAGDPNAATPGDPGLVAVDPAATGGDPTLTPQPTDPAPVPVDPVPLPITPTDGGDPSGNGDGGSDPSGNGGGDQTPDGPYATGGGSPPPPAPVAVRVDLARPAPVITSYDPDDEAPPPDDPTALPGSGAEGWSAEKDDAPSGTAAGVGQAPGAPAPAAEEGGGGVIGPAAAARGNGSAGARGSASTAARADVGAEPGAFADLAPGSLPVDVEAIERAIGRLLEPLGDLADGLTDPAGGPGLTTWLATMAASTATFELARRKLRRVGHRPEWAVAIDGGGLA